VPKLLSSLAGRRFQLKRRNSWRTTMMSTMERRERMTTMAKNMARRNLRKRLLSLIRRSLRLKRVLHQMN
jgi:hypothetical protein